MKYIFFIVICFFGCKAIEEAKDRKAVGRVLSKPNLTAEVGKRVAPCANDTTLISDTVIAVVTDTKYDTTITTDTIIDVVTKVVTKTVYIDKIRTIKEIVLDRSLENQLNDSIDSWKKRAYDSANGELTAKALAASWKSRARMWMWILIGLGVVLAFAVYFAIRKPQINIPKP
jgi:hypothetical protein